MARLVSSTITQEEVPGEPVSKIGQHHLTDYLQTHRETLKEADAKWQKDHPGQEPGTSPRSWKSFSRIRFPSKAFREGFARITWE